jgi:hypothetical protein
LWRAADCLIPVRRETTIRHPPVIAVDFTATIITIGIRRGLFGFGPA